MRGKKSRREGDNGKIKDREENMALPFLPLFVTMCTGVGACASRMSRNWRETYVHLFTFWK